MFIRRSVWLLWVCDRFMTLHLELESVEVSWPANKCQPTGVKPLFIATQASTVEQFQLHMNQRKCESKRMRNSKRVFLSYMLHVAAQLRSCVHPGVPPQSNGISMELPGQVKYKLFQPLPLPSFKGH